MFSPKVNFIGIGVQKAGTTWLSSILKEHPEIYIHPRKELHYFDKTKLPARTCIGVTELAVGASIEIDFIAGI